MENIAVNASFVRVFGVPALPARAFDALFDAWRPLGELDPAVHDRDLDCVTAGVRLGTASLESGLRACAALRGAAVLLIDVQTADGSMPADAAALGAVVADALDAPVHVVHRITPASAWAATRPISWGVDGLCVRAHEPTHPRPGSRDRVVSLEFGGPTIAMKVSLHGVPATAVRRICDATGSAGAGLAHIGAYPAISVVSGEPVIVLECSDPHKSPLHRALAIIDIEAARYGGSLGATTLLSHMPLSALLDTLSAKMGLAAQPTQIIETHLEKPAR
jgi:hypothetical protein